MFRSVWAIVSICLIGGASLATIIGWATGFVGQVVASAGGLWTRFTTWLSTPLGGDHILAGVGLLLVPVAILLVIFTIADN